jgi:hypothetical protein
LLPEVAVRRLSSFGIIHDDVGGPYVEFRQLGYYRMDQDINLAQDPLINCYRQGAVGGICEGMQNPISPGEITEWGFAINVFNALRRLRDNESVPYSWL